MFLFKRFFDKCELDRFLDKAMAGEFVPSNFEKEFYPTAITAPGLRQRTMAAKNDIDRMTEVEKTFVSPLFFDALAELDNDLQKSVGATKRLLQRAKENEKSKNFKIALRCYNLAMCYVPPDDLELINTIHYNRSSILYKLENFNGCLSDIESSMRLMGKSDKLSHEIQELKELVEKRDRGDNDDDKRAEAKARQEYMENYIFTVKGAKNPKIPSASNCVRILNDKNKGRYIIATADLDPGTTIIVEDPYVVVLDKMTRFDMGHCFRCFQPISDPISCPTCVFTTYCSDGCLKEDLKSGHEYLCPCLPFMHTAQFESGMLLAVKTICATGPKVLLEYFRSFKPDPPSKKFDHLRRKPKTVLPGFDPKTGVYDSDSYHQIYHLCSHPIETQNVMGTYAWASYAIVRIIHKRTDFFQNVKQPEKGEFRRFVASLILRHVAAFDYNSLAVKRSTGKKNVSTGETVNVEEMTAVYSVVSMINHSCDPSAFWEQQRNGKIAIYTNRRLKVGDEVTMSYGVGFQTTRFQERAIALGEFHITECNCIPCRYKWPVEDNVRKPYRILCPDCLLDPQFSRAYRSQFCYLKRFKKTGTCVVCKSQHEFINLTKETTKQVKMLLEALRLKDEGKPIEAIRLIIPAIVYYQENIATPSQDLITARYMLRDSYIDIVGI